MKNLILNHWLAKLVSVALAVVLWTVIKKNTETTLSPSRFQFGGERRFEPNEKFNIDTSRYAKPPKN
jgi:hypothetical protein